MVTSRMNSGAAVPTVKHIIAHHGGVVPDAALRHGRCSQRSKSGHCLCCQPLAHTPEATMAAEKLLGELDTIVKSSRKE